MGIPNRPLQVSFSRHATRRIRQRRLDYRQIERIMYTYPCEDGQHEFDPPGTDMRLVFADDMRMRTVITAMWRYR